MTLMARAAFDDNYVQVTSVREYVILSRPSVNEMVSQCSDAGWITVRQNKRGIKSIKGTPIVLELWEEYAGLLNEYYELVDKRET